MLDPWESLKVNERRQLLGADNGQNGGGGPEIDIYDISRRLPLSAALLERSRSAPDDGRRIRRAVAATKETGRRTA